MKFMRALALLLVVSAVAFAQTAAPLFYPKSQFFDNNGYPLAGGQVFTCVAGSSCPGTPLTTYTDATGGTPNPNPVILDSAGRAAIWGGSSLYKIVVEDVNNNLISTQDNVPAGSLPLSGSITGSNGAGLINYTSPASGAVTRTIASKLGDLISVKDFGALGNGTTDDTAAIAAAFTACPVGGTVYFPQGNYPTTGLTITRPCNIAGAGSGALDIGPPSWNTFSTGARIFGTSTTNDTIRIAPTVTNNWVSVTIRDVAVEGNSNVSGATAGDALHLIGAANSHVRNVSIEDVLVYHATGCGLELQDNTYGLSVLNVKAYRNSGAGGVCVTDTGAGQPSSLFFTNTFSDENTNDALSWTSAQANDAVITGGFWADSTNGIHVASTAVNATLHMIGVHIESNTGKGIWLAGGFNHTIEHAVLNANGYGIYLDNPSSFFGIQSARISDLWSYSNVTDDIYLTANARNTVLDSNMVTFNNLNIVDLGYQTQYIGLPYHQFAKTFHLMNSVQPCLYFQDTTTSQTNPNKGICDNSGVLKFFNNGGTASYILNDDGSFSFKNGASGGFTLTGSPTASRTLTVPDATGTLGIVIYSGQTSSIGGSSLAAGACTSGNTTTTITNGNSATQVIVASGASGDPGNQFSVRAIFAAGGYGAVIVCNTGTSAATPTAIAYNVRVLQ